MQRHIAVGSPPPSAAPACKPGCSYNPTAAVLSHREPLALFPAWPFKIQESAPNPFPLLTTPDKSIKCRPSILGPSRFLSCNDNDKEKRWKSEERLLLIGVERVGALSDEREWQYEIGKKIENTGAGFWYTRRNEI